MRWTHLLGQTTPAAAIAALMLLVAAPPVDAAGDRITRIVVFGDSLSDTGNTFDLFFLPQPPYWQGRWSNGSVWVETLATTLGAPSPTASRDGGTNYAYGGAESGSGSFFGLLDMANQVDAYLASGPAPARGDLHVLLGGANDFLNGENNASVVVANLTGHIEDLAAAGAAWFLVATLPPLGQTPDNRGTPDEVILDQITIEFNALYDDALASLARDLGVRIDRFDLHGFMTAILDDPAAAGYANTTDPAYDGAQVVANPDEYLFWDGVHPTRVAHAAAGEAAAELLATVVGDVDGDGIVGFQDLLAVLAAWGPCVGGCPEDVDGDEDVDLADLLQVLSNWS